MEVAEKPTPLDSGVEHSGDFLLRPYGAKFITLQNMNPHLNLKTFLHCACEYLIKHNKNKAIKQEMVIVYLSLRFSRKRAKDAFLACGTAAENVND